MQIKNMKTKQVLYSQKVDDTTMLDMNIIHKFIPSRQDAEFSNVTQIAPVIKHPSIPEPMCPDFNSGRAIVDGLIKRLVHVVNPDPSVLDEFRNFVRKFIHKHYEPLPELPLTHENLDLYWLNNAHKTLKEKEMFHRELQDFIENGPCADFYLCNAFTKKELYTEAKYPRVISSRSNQFKAVVSPFVKECEHAACYNKHFIKGKVKTEFTSRLYDIAAKFNHVYETDYSSFEGSYSMKFLRVCEYQFLRYMAKNNPVVSNMIKHVYTHKNLLKWSNRKGQYGSCSVPGSRMSGEMWTSCMNGFTNMMLFLFCVEKTEVDHPKEYDFVVEGDDGFLGTNFKLDTSWVGKLGFNLKCDAVANVNDCSFCGICMYEGKYVPDIPKQLFKFGFTFDPGCRNSNKRRKSMARAKALSLYHNGSGIPILQELALNTLKLTKGSKVDVRMLSWWHQQEIDQNLFSHNQEFVREPISIGMRKFVERRWNISVEDQIRIESMLRNNTSLTAIVRA